MAVARSTIVHDDHDAVYHCTTRCVRRCFLMGDDPPSGRNFDHRRRWLKARIHHLCTIFAVESFALAILNNHYHVVTKMTPSLAATWSPEEIVTRWLLLYPRFGTKKDEPAITVDSPIFQNFCSNPVLVATWRKRLASLSWLMRSINEYIARRANKEDEAKGRFWEGRYSAKRLDDEGAILACMCYVDLNPIRADMADTPESSAFTSVYDRVTARQSRKAAADVAKMPTDSLPTALQQRLQAVNADDWLTPIDQIQMPGLASCWLLSEDEYLTLVDETGRTLREDKTGSIPAHLAPILERLDLDHQHWLTTVTLFGKRFKRVVAKEPLMEQAARQAGQHWFVGKSFSRQVYRGTKRPPPDHSAPPDQVL
jgi:REP element-mobilizing transposase RayT